MYKFIRNAIYLTSIVSALLLIKAPSVEDFSVSQTHDSKKIYRLVQKVQPELYDRLKKTYVVSNVPFAGNDSLTLQYIPSNYTDHLANCGVTSGLLKKILEEKGLRTEYVAIKGENKDLEGNIRVYSSADSVRWASANHIFLKSGNTYIDPTWWQFFEDADKVKDRIAVGTKENLHKYFIRFNNDASLMDKHERMKKYFSLFAKPEDLDPNCLVEYAAALYSEKSTSDTIRIPITLFIEIDSYFMQQLDFFKERAIIKAPDYRYVKEIFLN
jgi:hypothetical protein